MASALFGCCTRAAAEQCGCDSGARSRPTKLTANCQKTEASYKRSIELQPNYWAGYNRLGAFYSSRARYAEAAEMFSRVVQLVPDNQRGYNNLGGMYIQMGRYDDRPSRVSYFNREVTHSPGIFECRHYELFSWPLRRSGKCIRKSDTTGADDLPILGKSGRRISLDPERYGARECLL